MAPLFLLLVLSSALAITPKCTVSNTNGEDNYYCQLDGNDSNIIINTMVDSYINVKCNFYGGRESNFTCSDVPDTNLANGEVIPSLSIDKCPPSILQCVNKSFNITGVEKLSLISSLAPIREEDLQNITEVTFIWIRSGKNQSFPYFLLHNTPGLQNLRFLDTSLYFNNMVPVQHPLSTLHMIGANIPYVPDGAFDGLTNVKKFSMSGNKFEVFKANLFKDMESLEDFYCVKNSLRTLETGLFSNTRKLVNLTLDSNNLDNIPDGLFNGLENLERITIKYNANSLNINGDSFANLPALKSVTMTRSKIKFLPSDMFANSTSVNTIIMSHNDIDSVPGNLFKNSVNLEFLDLSHNRINVLERRTFISLRRLVELHLEWNDLQVLPDGIFANTGSMKRLYLDFNRLYTIDTKVFGGLHLELLSMASNVLSADERKYYNLEEKISPPFPEMSDLKTIILKNNSFDAIPNGLNILSSLKFVDLSRNKFTRLTPSDLQFISVDVKVDLTHNNISTVSLPNGSFNSTIANKITNRVMLLDDNPIKCDCRIFPLLIRNASFVPVVPEPRIELGDSVCVSPESLKGRFVRNLTPEMVVCDLDICPESCKSCVFRPETGLEEYDCEHVKDLSVSSVNVKLKLATQPPSLDLNVVEMNLTGSNIEYVTFKPTPSLKMLDLSNNSLTRPPVEFLKWNNISLFLRNNSFECSCAYIQDLKLMKSNKKILDFDRVTCKYGLEMVSFKDVNVATLCYNQTAIITAGSTFVILLIIGAIIAGVIIKNYTKIRIYLMHKSVFSRFYEDAEDLGKMYDCFVSYSHKDSKFVEQQLIPKLEDDFKQKTCVHYRDWNVGDLILTQIHRSVESSRKTIIVLSESFLDSMWATVEFNLAHTAALKENKARVILLLLEDVSKHPKLSEEFKSYIATNTYLLCSDPKFWERLERSLPARKKKFVWKKAGDVKGGLNVQLNSDNKLVNVANKV